MSCQTKSSHRPAARLQTSVALQIQHSALSRSGHLVRDFPDDHQWSKSRRPSSRSSRLGPPAEFAAFRYLPKNGGTNLLIGPLWAMALVGTPRGHILPLGSPARGAGTSCLMDAHPRTVVGEEFDPFCGRASHRRLPARLGLVGQRDPLLVVHLAVLPHRQHRRRYAPRQRQLR